MPTYQVETPQRCYAAIVERGVIGRAAQYIPPKTGKVFVVTTEDVWRHAGAQLAAGLAGVSYDVLHLPGGEEQKRLAPAGATRRADGATRRRPLQHGDRLRRRHRQRHGRIPGRDLHARHPGPADSHHPAGAGGRGHRRQDRRQPGQRQEPDRQLPPAARGAHRPRHPRYAARARIPRRALRNHQGGHHPRTRTLHLPDRIQRRRAGPQPGRGGPHHRRERPHEGGSGLQRRTRRRPAPHPEFRTHLRPRAGGRDRNTSASCTGRR